MVFFYCAPSGAHDTLKQCRTNVNDGRVISLIHKYLNAGAISRGMSEKTEVGMPQGGPLSPLLSNIMLNELDKELTRRGNRFVHYPIPKKVEICQSLSMKKRNKPLLFDRKSRIVRGIILSDEEVCKITLLYMDVYLLVHLILEYILLRITQRLLGLKREALRPLLGAAFTSICDVLFILISLPTIIKYFMTYILVTFVEIKISFRLTQKKDYIKAFLLLYALAFMAGGFLESIYMNVPWVRKYGFSILTLSIAGIFLYLFMQKLFYIWKETSIKQCLKNVEIHIGGKVISCMGLLDTGNHLFDPITGKPVLIVEREELIKYGIEIKQEQYRVIPYHSLGKKDGLLEGFIADEVRIKDVEEAKDKVEAKVMIGIYEGKLSNNGSYQMILHPLL